MSAQSAPIGVFDSGMGGVSVLRDLRAAFPGERFVYFGDNANAPYGTRAPEEIRALSFAAAQRLLRRGIKALVIACNTATAAADEALRATLSIPVIGIEPELRRAVEAAQGKKVVVFATAATLSQERFARARARYCPDAVAIPAPELVLMVERGVLLGAEPEAFFRARLSSFASGQVGAIVLGCTHFPFLRGAIAKVAPQIPCFDGNARVIEHLREALAERGLLAEGSAGAVELSTSSEDPAVYQRMRALLEGECA